MTLSINPRKPVRYQKGIWKLATLIIFIGCFSGNVSAQDLIITGTVRAPTGEPLPGANVSVRGTTQGSITNLDGEFSIEVPSRESLLVFSFIGYASHEMKVGNQTTINVVLEENLDRKSVV